MLGVWGFLACMHHRAGEGTQAFCSGGDQSVRGEGGYVGPDRIPRLNVLDLQACPHKRLFRTKPQFK